MKSTILALRLPLILAINFLLWTVSFVVGLGLRLDFEPDEMLGWGRMEQPLLLILAFRGLSYVYWGLNRGYWRYASTDDLIRIIKAHTSASVAFAAAIMIGGIASFPRSVIFIDLGLSILICGGSRFLVRVACERWLTFNADRNHSSRSLQREVIILGGGDSGHLVVKNLQSQLRLSYRPIMVLDDNIRIQGQTISGVPITGRLAELADLLEANTQVSAVILAIPTLSRPKIESIEAACKTFGVPLKRLQTFEDIALMDADEEMPGLSIESVLERDLSVEHEDVITDSLRGRSVMVTGAGGSIGSELVRQILTFKPKRLVLIDNNEYHTYKIRGEIEGLCPEVKVDCYIATIVNEERLRTIFNEVHPEILFHAAAYKHVPLMEQNVYEAFTNNVIGTRNLLRTARETGVEHFVLISTDKAVNSCSVMGHSKRLCELLVQSFSQNGANGGSMTSAIVRFGNVINSNGSVIPLFKEQILSGGPITVTHPEMRRYFMSVREAVRLVLAAGTLGENGEIFILDMGKPVRIVDVAKKMLALYGRRDIPVVFTGIRPGERLFEELIGKDERSGPTRLNKVQQVTGSALLRDELLSWLSMMERQLNTMSDRQIASVMRDFLSRNGMSGIVDESEPSLIV